MGYKFNPFSGKLDTTDSPDGVFNSVEVNGDITLDDGIAGPVTTLQTITPTQNNTISLPNATGTVALVAGSSGQLLYNNAGANAGISGSSVTAGGNVTLNQVLVPNGTTTNPGFAFSANTDCGFYIRSTNQVGTVVDGSLKHETSANELTLFDFPIAFAPNTASASDLVIRRDAANTLAQRNGTAAQTFRVYNTYTSSTNYELGKLEWNSNAFRIGTEKGSGGGTARALELQTDGTTRWTISASSGSLQAGTNAAVYVENGGIGRANYSYISFPTVDGNITLNNWNANGFGRLQFGGTTSSFPALKRNSAVLETKLADDSAYAQHAASVFQAATAHTVATLPATPVVGMIARVTDATAPAVGATVTGGGSAAALCWYNGTNWTVIGV